MKNRKLNDVVNKAIYGQTQENIDKTINVFKKRPKLAGDPRMQELMYQKPITVDNALQDLYDDQKKEDLMNADEGNMSGLLRDHNKCQSQIVEKLERQDPEAFHYPSERVDKFDPDFYLGG
jgi:hypothetical protein